MGNFDDEVEFIPVAIIAPEFLEQAEVLIIASMFLEFSKVGYAREWFNTSKPK